MMKLVLAVVLPCAQRSLIAQETPNVIPNEIFVTVTPLHLPVFGIVLSLDKSECRALNGVADIRRHEFVTITPPPQLAHRIHVVPKPMAIQGIACGDLGSEVVRMHDPSE